MPLELVVAPAIEKRIFVVRDRQVMLDEDLADLYGVETRVLVQQVKRNAKRFPEDFMFQLTSAEAEALRSQIVISNEGRGGRRYAPYVFTEQGVAMLSCVLRIAGREVAKRYLLGSDGSPIMKSVFGESENFTQQCSGAAPATSTSAASIRAAISAFCASVRPSNQWMWTKGIGVACRGLGSAL